MKKTARYKAMHRIYTWNFFFVGLGHEYSLTIRFYYTSAVLAQIETKTEAAEFSAFSVLKIVSFLLTRCVPVIARN